MLQKEHKVMRIGFVGIGKLGKPVATVMALKDHDVMCYDVNPNNMNKEFTEIEADDNGNPNGFKDMLAKADLKFGSLQDVITHGEIIFTAIQTPHAEQYGGHVRVPKDAVDFDYSYLIDCIKNINACEINEPKVVVIISTVLPTTIREKILPLITNPNIKIVYNPYFIAMSTVVPDFLHPEFVLIGVDDPMAAAKLCDFYNTLYSEPSDMCWSGDLTLIDKKTTYACMTIEEAELVKVAYNFFISSKINYANFLMEICHKLKNMNVDVITNTLAKATKRIISNKYMTGGMGDGGNCHPRDAIAMRYLSQKIGMDYDFSGMIMQTREKQTEWLANLIKEQSEKTKLPIVILGKAFKENMALTGGSPAILLSNLLQEAAIPHTHYDPLVDKDKSFKLIPAVYFIATKHNIFKNYLFPEGCVILDPFRYLKHLAHCPKLTYIPIGDSTNENP